MLLFLANGFCSSFPSPLSQDPSLLYSQPSRRDITGLKHSCGKRTVHLWRKRILEMLPLIILTITIIVLVLHYALCKWHYFKLLHLEAHKYLLILPVIYFLSGRLNLFFPRCVCESSLEFYIPVMHKLHYNCSE